MPRLGLGIHEFDRDRSTHSARNSWTPRPSLGVTSTFGSWTLAGLSPLRRASVARADRFIAEPTGGPAVLGRFAQGSQHRFQRLAEAGSLRRRQRVDGAAKGALAAEQDRAGPQPALLAEHQRAGPTIGAGLPGDQPLLNQPVDQ